MRTAYKDGMAAAGTSLAALAADHNTRNSPYCDIRDAGANASLLINHEALPFGSEANIGESVRTDGCRLKYKTTQNVCDGVYENPSLEFN